MGYLIRDATGQMGNKGKYRSQHLYPSLVLRNLLTRTQSCLKFIFSLKIGSSDHYHYHYISAINTLQNCRVYECTCTLLTWCLTGKRVWIIREGPKFVFHFIKLQIPFYKVISLYLVVFNCKISPQHRNATI